MKRSAIVALSLLGLLVVALAAYAGPFGLFSESKSVASWRAGPRKVRLEVTTDDKIARPILIVPQSLLVDVAVRKADSRSSSPMVIGLALSAAFAVGGLWTFGRAGRRAGTIVLLLAISGAGIGVAWADIPGPWGRTERRDRFPFPPPLPVEQEKKANPIPAEVLTSVTLPSDIEMEIVKDGTCLVLKVPAKKAAEVAKPEAPRVIATTPKQ